MVPHRRCSFDELRRCNVAAFATGPQMQVLGIRQRQWQGVSERSNAVLLSSCTTTELLQLRECCHTLMQSISDRLENISSLKVEDSPRSSCATEKRTLPGVQVAGLMSCSSSQPPSSPTSMATVTAQYLNSDLFLWQLPQELFPSKRTSNHRSDFSSREGSQQPTSPSMLSVTTAPSDSGTVRFGRPAMEPCSAHSTSLGAQVMSPAAPQEPSSFNPTCYTPLQDMERSTHIHDAPSPPITTLGDLKDMPPSSLAPLDNSVSRDAFHPGIPVGGAALNAVPECNSSLETPDSCGLMQTSSRMLRGAQSVLPCSSILDSFKSPVRQVACHSYRSRSLRTSADGSGSDAGPHAGNSNNYDVRGASASSMQSTRSKSRRSGSKDTAPMVQYGFHSPETSGRTPSPATLTDQRSHASISHTAPADPSPMLTVGNKLPRKCGLLSVSLSQCASNTTSPHAVSPTVPPPALGLPCRLAQLSLTQRAIDSSTSPPQSFVRSPSGGTLKKGTLFAVPSCSPIASHCETGICSDRVGEGTLTTASGCSPLGASPLSTVSAAIPAALHMQMQLMGYHRPSRVLAEVHSSD